MITSKSIEGKEVSGRIIKDELKGKSKGKNFFEYVDELKVYKDSSQAQGSRANYRKEIKRFMNFAGTYLSISDIDPTLLRKYELAERKRRCPRIRSAPHSNGSGRC